MTQEAILYVLKGIQKELKVQNILLMNEYLYSQTSKKKDNLSNAIKECEKLRKSIK